MEAVIRTPGEPTEAATGGALWKKVFLEISQNSQENTCARVSFLIKLLAQDLKPFLQNTSGGSNVDKRIWADKYIHEHHVYDKNNAGYVNEGSFPQFIWGHCKLKKGVDE